MRVVGLTLGGWAVVIGVGLLLLGLWGAGFSDSSGGSATLFLVATPIVTVVGLILIFVSRRG